MLPLTLFGQAVSRNELKNTNDTIRAQHTRVFDTIADMTNSTAAIGATNSVFVKAFSGTNNLGGGTFIKTHTNGLVIDFGIVFPSQFPKMFWKRDYFGQRVDVTWYGAKGDGVDDTLALTNAAANAPTNATLFFPLGRFLTTTNINLYPRRLSVLGSGRGGDVYGGSRISGTVAGPIFDRQSTDATDIGPVISGVHINNSHTNGYGIKIKDVISAMVEHNAVNAWRAIDISDSCFSVAVVANRLSWAGSTTNSVGIVMGNHSSALANDLVGFNHGIRAGGAGSTIHGNRIEVNGVGVMLGMDGDGDTYAFGGSVKGNSFEANDIAMFMWSVAEADITGNRILGSENAPSGSSDYGIYLQTVTYSTIGDVSPNGAYSGAPIASIPGAFLQELKLWGIPDYPYAIFNGTHSSLSAPTLSITNGQIRTQLSTNAFVWSSPGGILRTGIIGSNLSFDPATGTLSASGGSGTPGGNSGDVQFNETGALDGTNTVHFNRTNNQFRVRGSIQVTNPAGTTVLEIARTVGGSSYLNWSTGGVDVVSWRFLGDGSGHVWFDNASNRAVATYRTDLQTLTLHPTNVVIVHNLVAGSAAFEVLAISTLVVSNSEYAAVNFRAVDGTNVAHVVMTNALTTHTALQWTNFVLGQSLTAKIKGEAAGGVVRNITNLFGPTTLLRTNGGPYMLSGAIITLPPTTNVEINVSIDRETPTNVIDIIYVYKQRVP